MRHCSACPINPITIYKRGSISHCQRHRICRPSRHVDGADVVVLVDSDSGAAVQAGGFKDASVLRQREVVYSRRIAAVESPASCRPVAASSKVPIFVGSGGERDAAVAFAVSNARTRGWGSSTSDGDVAEVHIGHRHSSGCDGAGGADGVAAAEMSHGGICACGEGERACDGLVGSKGDVLQTGRGDASKGQVVEAVGAVEGDGACAGAGEGYVVEGLVVSKECWRRERAVYL